MKQPSKDSWIKSTFIISSSAWTSVLKKFYPKKTFRKLLVTTTIVVKLLDTDAKMTLFPWRRCLDSYLPQLMSFRSNLKKPLVVAYRTLLYFSHSQTKHGAFRIGLSPKMDINCRVPRVSPKMDIYAIVPGFMPPKMGVGRMQLAPLVYEL